MKSLFRTALLGVALASGSAAAVEFNQVQGGESSVTFAYRQMGVPLEGGFAKFKAQTAFDPARPDKAHARIDIDLSSIDTGSEDGNDEVKKKPWFDSAVFPTASFVATGVKSLGGNRYEVAGKLTLKGRTQEVVAPFIFQASGARGLFDGAFTLKRLDYNIGEGVWADLGTVANEIQIKFHFVLTATPARK